MPSAKETEPSAPATQTTVWRNKVNRVRQVLRATNPPPRVTIPESLRWKRKESRDASSTVSTMTPSTTTRLHQLCALPHVTLDELMECTNHFPQAITTLDTQGRYPLHILGDNETLITSSLSGRDVATIFAGHLMNEFPSAIIVTDHDGFLPFARIVADWIDWAHDREKPEDQEQEAQEQRSRQQRPQSSKHDTKFTGDDGSADRDSSNMSSGLNTERQTFGVATRLTSKNEYYSTRKGLFSGRGSHHSTGTRRTSNANDSDGCHRASPSAGRTQYWQLGSFHRRLFPRLESWEEVEWCFAMMSTAFDILTRSQNASSATTFPYTSLSPPGTPTRRNTTRVQQVPYANALDSSQSSSAHHSSVCDQQNSQKDPTRSTKKAIPKRNGSTVFVETIAQKMPRLLSTVFLVDDDGRNSRERLLETLIVRRLLLCPQTVGMWIIEMLNHGGSPAKRAVDYLELVSRVSVEDYTGSYGDVHSSDMESFNKDRQDVFEAVGSLRGTIASLVSLDLRETERAASSAVIWHTMNQKLSRPFVLGLVLIDLLLHVILMVAFRPIANPSAELTQLGVDPSGVVYLISIHYLLRKSLKHGCSSLYRLWRFERTSATCGHSLTRFQQF